MKAFIIIFLLKSTLLLAQDLHLPSPESLGFKRTVKETPTKVEITYQDVLTGEKTIFSHSPANFIQQVSIQNKKQQLTHQLIRKDSEWSSMDFVKGTMMTVESVGLKNYVVLNYQLEDKKWNEISRVARDSSIMEQSPENFTPCNAPITDVALDKHLADLSDIIKLNLGGSFTDDWVPASPNLKINENCRPEYEGGLQSLVEDMDKGINKGLQCMLRLSNENKSSDNPIRARRAAELRRMARMIAGNFDSKAKENFKINCSTEASVFGEFEIGKGIVMRASVTDYFSLRNPPGITLNTVMTKKKTHGELQSAFFHEMLHHTGFIHEHDWNTNFDIVYQLQRCCFDGIACEQVMTMEHGEPYKVRRPVTVKD